MHEKMFQIFCEIIFYVWFKSGVRADKPDEDLYYINKKDINSNLGAKKPKLTLQEKLDNLNCYRLLRPDTENSAPAHIVTIRQEPCKDSKRQAKLNERKLSKLKGKNLVQIDQVPKWKLPKPIVPKTQVIIKADFDKDLWNSKLLLFFKHVYV